MKFTIYKLINDKTGKTYTGCTRAPKNRIAQHFALLKQGKHNCKEMQKDFNNGDGFSFQYVKQIEEIRFDNAMITEEEHIDENTYNIRRNTRGKFRNGSIKKDVLLRMLKNSDIRIGLVREFDISMFTADRWIKDNNKLLTTPSALKVIREELGLTDDQILEETKNKVA